MTEFQGIYKCEVCGNIVEVLHTGVGELVCCGQPMVLQTENTVDASQEKHVPVAEEKDGKVIVKVGSAPHPMEEKHYIEWIQLIKGEDSRRIFLQPGQDPVAEFDCADGFDKVREYCNIHGLWTS